ncbi:hypothetical protein [Chitinophaga pinensis]|uniref:Uncharacterized protein n=1 Tax=Chitinophaga pinensis (strain ATCC 43595 / DSM 2588 / LMG 13176 / NBRC 15968 / NCIMB 11800 / UQM 2034) TaxID=485918 RepID=A0A979GYV7_CHIPD|nr:hypothetical protein [Chitinophaga pinensis]ACU63441.1 conserved hypothetical protein [Chitinophaga pinensis DSM 2588]
MNETSKQQLSLLRQRIPVGLSSGLKLLENAGGDINKAELLFREDILQTLVRKIGLPEDVIQRHLISNNFDIDATVKRIDEERFTLTERILRRYKHKAEAVDQVRFAVLGQNDVYKGSWLDFKQLTAFPKEVYCLLTLNEWLLYADYEGLDVALSFELEVITNQLETVLGLSALADALRQTQELADLLYKKYEITGNHENYIKAARELDESDIYRQCEQMYKEQRDLLIERLYDLVTANVHLFP